MNCHVRKLLHGGACRVQPRSSRLTELDDDVRAILVGGSDLLNHPEGRGNISIGEPHRRPAVDHVIKRH
jgi:hypothetical protein